jgi:toxin ParE1/3/4
MAVYSLSAKAATDLEGIYEYTIREFGLEKARTYLLGPHKRFEMLAVQPELGRSAAELAPDLRRSEYQHHVAFYVPRAGGVRIVRVLHESMDVKRHLEG